MALAGATRHWDLVVILGWKEILMDISDDEPDRWTLSSDPPSQLLPSRGLSFSSHQP